MTTGTTLLVGVGDRVLEGPGVAWIKAGPSAGGGRGCGVDAGLAQRVKAYARRQCPHRRVLVLLGHLM